MAGVLLLHGISRTAWSMVPIERALRRAGYATCNLDYSSRHHALDRIADDIAGPVAQFAADIDGPVHIVTHSMGGLIARVLLARRRPARLGRVVMLAPPNQGSEIADLLHAWPPYRWWFGPAGGQLVTRRGPELRVLLGSIDFQLGVIAGDRSLYPLASLLLPVPNDGRVAVAATRVDDAHDHLVLPVSHPLIVRDRRAIAQTLTFLRTGRFDRGRTSQP